MQDNKKTALKIGQILTVIFFIFIILIFILDYPLNLSDKDFENVENREFAILPKFDVAHLDPFPEKFELFYNDNFNFRDEIIKLNNLFKLKVLNVSPIEKIIEGKDGWLYSKKYIDNYTNKNLLTNLELDSLKTIFSERTKWLNDRNILHYIVIVPTKSTIYPEFLPDYIKKRNENTRTDQFIDAIKDIPGLRLIDLKQYILEEKQRSHIRTFHRTDQHWNEYGGLIAYLAIIKELQKNFPNLYDYTFKDFLIDSVTVNGRQQAKQLKLEKELKEVDVKVSFKDKIKYKRIDTFKYEPHKTFKEEWGYQLFYENIDSDLPSILIIRDSFTNDLYRYMCNSFSRSIFIWDNWCYELNEHIVLKEKPDIFMTVIVESSIPNIIYKHQSVRTNEGRL